MAKGIELKLKHASMEEGNILSLNVTVCGIPVPKIPYMPTHLKVTDIAGDTVVLEWKKPYGGIAPDYYEIEKRIYGFSRWDFVCKTNGDDTVYKLNNLRSNTEYYFRVTANNDGGSSIPTQQYHKTKPAVTYEKVLLLAPRKPTNFEIRDITDCSINLTWNRPNAGDDIDDYVIEQRECASADWSVIQTLNKSVNHFVVERLQPNTKHFFRISARNEKGSTTTEELLCETKTCVLWNPTDSQVKCDRDCAMTSTWRKENGGGIPCDYVIEQRQIGSKELKYVKDVPSFTTTYEEKYLQPNTTHYVGVTAREEGGLSTLEKIGFKTKQTAPMNPTGLQATDGTDRSVILTWSKPSVGVERCDYVIEKKEYGSRKWNKVETVPPTSTTYEAKYLQPNTKYFFRITAQNECGVCTSEEIICQTKQTAPLKPTDLQVATHERSVTITWSKPNEGGETYETYDYVIEKRESELREWNKVETVPHTVTTYSVEYLQPNTNYCFRITARNDVGSNTSDEINCKTKQTIPMKPTDLQVTAHTERSVTLTWSKPNRTGETCDYVIKRRESGSREWNEVEAVPQTTYEVKYLKPNTKYYFRICARSEGGLTTSEEIMCTTKQAAPLKPTDLQVTPHKRSVTITWSKPDEGGETYETYDYVIEKRESELREWNKVETVPHTVTTYSVEYLQPNTNYCFRITARNDVGSNTSDEINCKTKQTIQMKPTDLQVTAHTERSVTLTWSKPNRSGETCDYVIKRRESGSREWNEVETVLQTTYEVKYLKPNTKYYFHICARSEGGLTTSEEIMCTTKQADLSDGFFTTAIESKEILSDINADTYQMECPASCCRSICLSSNKDVKLMLPCSHAFCIQCSVTIFELYMDIRTMRLSCPICKQCASQDEFMFPKGRLQFEEEQRSLYNYTSVSVYKQPISDTTYTERPPVKRIRYESKIKGLPNIGMTCYANSIIQVLAQTPNLQNHLQDLINRHSLNKTSSLTGLLLSVLKDINSKGPGAEETVRGTVSYNNVYGLVGGVIQGDRSFQLGEQNDSHSFLISLLNAVKGEVADDDEAVSLFQGYMRNKFAYNCPSKHFGYSDKQMFSSLLIPIDNIKERCSVMDGIKELSQKEIFKNNILPCTKCSSSHRDTVTEKTLEILDLPEILILQLGKFKQVHNHLSKLYKNVQYDLTLPLDVFPHGRHRKTAGEIYKLYGVTLHSGSLHGGHYTAYVKYNNGNSYPDEWYEISDSYVQRISDTDALHDHQQAFLLFYHLAEK